MQPIRRIQRSVAAVVAATLFVTACGGGDDTADDAAESTEETTAESGDDTATEAAEGDEVEYDLSGVSPAERTGIEAAVADAGIAYAVEGFLLYVKVEDEAAVDSIVDTVVEPMEEVAAGGAEGTKNKGLKKLGKKLKKGANKVGDGVKDVGNDVANGATGVVNDISNTADASLNVVSKEYRNASGQVVDGLGNVLTAIPTNWPSNLGADALKMIVQTAESQLNSAMNQLQQQGKQLKNMSAGDAEKTINALLGTYPVPTPKLPIGGFQIAPSASPIYVKIQPSQWADANAANLELNINFLGVMSYRVGFGCLGFPNGWTAAPTFTFNGGCHNPWNLMASVNQVQASAQRVANKAGQQLQSVSNQILSVLTSAAGGATNPRNIPPLLLDLPINEFLGYCCSLGFPSSNASENPGKGNPKKDTDKKDQTPDEEEGDSVMAQAFGNMAKDAALAFSIPELQGLNFSLTPDLSPVAIFDERWTNAGQMEFGLQLGMFGIATATVAMGCVTFGTDWSQTPSFSFEGGCDKSWDVEFSALGYTTSSKRIDARTGN
jgi:hypothetical protein